MSDSALHLTLLVYLTVFGAALGSFLNVVIGRLPEGLSIVWPGSRCPSCLTPIRWYDNVPIVSWLVLRARCRHCGVQIGPRYVLLEIVTAVLVATLFVRFGVSLTFLQWLILGSMLVVIVFLDIDYWWIPDKIVFPGMAVALVFALLPGGLGIVAALWGLVPAALIYLTGWVFMKITRREGLGFGDVKLLAMIGLGLGLMPTLNVLFMASIQGVLIGGLLSLLGGHAGKEELNVELLMDDELAWEPPPRSFPFGPFLALAAFEVLLLPGVFLDLPLKWIHDLVGLAR